MTIKVIMFRYADNNINAKSRIINEIMSVMLVTVAVRGGMRRGAIPVTVIMLMMIAMIMAMSGMTSRQ